MSVCRGARDLTFQYPCSYRFPPRAGGTKQRFPLRSRGNLKEGGRLVNFARAVGITSARGNRVGHGSLQTGETETALSATFAAVGG
jgi:hypothetical protein